jgi:hypothetical protein
MSEDVSLSAAVDSMMLLAEGIQSTNELEMIHIIIIIFIFPSARVFFGNSPMSRVEIMHTFNRMNIGCV